MLSFDAIKNGEVVFTGTFKECDKYADEHSNEQFVFVQQGKFNAEGALQSLECLKKGLQEAGTFSPWYQGDYEMIRQFLLKVGEAK